MKEIGKKKHIACICFAYNILVRLLSKDDLYAFNLLELKSMQLILFTRYTLKVHTRTLEWADSQAN